MRRLTLATIALVAVVAACSAFSGASPSSQGQADRERLVVAYLQALEHRDAAAIAAMVSPGVEASSAISSELDRYGGVSLHDGRVSYLDEFAGAYVVATVTGSGDDGMAYSIRVPISRVGDRYYLALGQAGPSGSEANPASPSP